ncbi:MAG: M15 family metallopeptidase [Mycolicibacter algericus]|uniref:M15 family metallopeptidase n=1 Tax=Mycolicibacter algericus TaxID=1288388 RepID=UPI003C70891B
MASENNWEPAKARAEQCQWVSIPGANVTLQLLRGQPLKIMRAFAADYNAYVEPLRDADSASWTPTNKVATSNHLNGTAMDLNWNSHPFQTRNTFTPEQVAVIHELLDFYEGTVYWAGDWKNPIDEMHWQMGYETYGNPHTQDFIDRKIRVDGYSTFRRGDIIDAAPILAQVMGNRLSLNRYRELLPAYAQQLIACDCTTVERIAMNAAQLGHESAGLYYTEEIASGAAYESRADLGNTQPGDGMRFKGRSWIQITGRSNYTRLSRWAFDKGYVPSPTYFVDNPAALASDQYAGLGAAWYWVVARPDINALADSRDLITVTRRINGGTNGLDDRRARYDRALRMGDQLLALVGERQEEDEMAGWSPDRVERAMVLLENIAGVRRVSRSPLRRPGEGEVDTCAGFAWGADGYGHAHFVYLAAKFGDRASLQRLVEVAAADPERFPDRVADAKLAAAMLAAIERDNPEALRGFMGGVS